MFLTNKKDGVSYTDAQEREADKLWCFDYITTNFALGNFEKYMWYNIKWKVKEDILWLPWLKNYKDNVKMKIILIHGWNAKKFFPTFWFCEYCKMLFFIIYNFKK